MHHWHKILSAVFILIFVCCSNCAQALNKSINEADFELVEGIITSHNGMQWHYAFDIARQEKAVQLNVAINLIPVHGVTVEDIRRKKGEWEEAIEDIWSNRFGLQIKGRRIYPIVVDVNFNGPEFHHEVLISKREGRTDELHWSLNESPQIVAHEFGHMLGCYDEYPGGAIMHSEASAIDGSSIMYDALGEGKVVSRHFRIVKSWFEKHIDSNEVRLMSLMQ